MEVLKELASPSPKYQLYSHKMKKRAKSKVVSKKGRAPSGKSKLSKIKKLKAWLKSKVRKSSKKKKR